MRDSTSCRHEADEAPPAEIIPEQKVKHRDKAKQLQHEEVCEEAGEVKENQEKSAPEELEIVNGAANRQFVVPGAIVMKLERTRKMKSVGGHNVRIRTRDRNYNGVSAKRVNIFPVHDQPQLEKAEKSLASPADDDIIGTGD